MKIKKCAAEATHRKMHNSNCATQPLNNSPKGCQRRVCIFTKNKNAPFFGWNCSNYSVVWQDYSIIYLLLCQYINNGGSKPPPYVKRDYQFIFVGDGFSRPEKTSSFTGRATLPLQNQKDKKNAFLIKGRRLILLFCVSLFTHYNISSSFSYEGR